MSVTVARCNPQDPEQKFRWVSGSRLLSVAHHLCVGASEIKDFVKVLLFPCDEKSNLQQWECKNATLFGLVGQDLHFNWGNRNERNIVIYTGFGSWSRWRIYGTEGDLCSKGYQGRCLEPARTSQNQLEPARTSQNQLEPARTSHNQLEPARTHQNTLGPTRFIQNHL